MAFYLSKEREEDCAGAYRRYQDYLRQHQSKFPPSAYELATAMWYQDANEHKCPHDASLEYITISESGDGNVHDRNTSIKIRLMNAYDDGFIELCYPRVFSYRLILPDCTRGHKDWVYDEFTLSPQGRVAHEIEWRDDDCNWVIEASDVKYLWIPK